MREVAPPSLRYQFLQAGPADVPFAVKATAFLVGAGAVGAAAIATGTPQLLFTAPILGAFLNAVMGGVYKAVPTFQKDPRCVAIGLVPWGIVVDPDGVPEAFTWRHLREVTSTFIVYDRRADNTTPRIAVVTIDLGAFRVRASAEEGDWLAQLTGGHARFARLADYPVAADIEGKTPLAAGELPPTLALLRQAEQLLASADGRATLGLESGGYRTTASRVVGPETQALLKVALGKSKAKLDPGPLAAILAAELGVTGLLPELLALITSPSPLLGAIARAAALRLGASRMASGSLDEVALFMTERDLAELRTWSEK